MNNKIITELLSYNRHMGKKCLPFTDDHKLISLEINSRHADVATTSSGYATVSPSLVKAMLSILNGSMSNGSSHGSTYLCEYNTEFDGETSCDLVAYDTSGSVQAATYHDADGSLSVYTLGKEMKVPKDGTAILGAMLPVFMKDSEFETNYLDFKKEYESGFKDIDKAAELIAMLSSNVYYRLKKDDILLDVAEAGNIRPLTQASITSLYVPEEVYNGSFEIFGGGEVVKSKKKSKTKISIKDLAGKYKDPTRILSKAEKNLVPKMEDWYEVPNEVVDICETITKSSKTSYPMRVFTLRGGAGSGKSKATQAIASALNLPHVFYTCGSDTEIFDFIGQVIPKSEDDITNPEVKKLIDMGGINATNVAALMHLPSMDDVEFAPDEAYFKITGKYFDDGIDDVEKVAICFREFNKKVDDKISSLNISGSSDQGFVYTETPFIKAIKNGYLVEIQEPNVIASPGVLVGLNGLLEEGTITLPTGEVITRHPDAVIIFTTNNDYVGCNSMNQSLIDRSCEIIDMETPDVDKLTSRVASITGYKNLEELKEMSHIILDIASLMKDTGIDEGVCGVRSLIAWASKSMITGNVYKAFETTVLSKTSSNPDDREILKSRIEESSFRKSGRKRKI